MNESFINNYQSRVLSRSSQVTGYAVSTCIHNSIGIDNSDICGGVLSFVIV